MKPDLMKVDDHSELANDIKEIFLNNKIDRAIETGTYNGIGTTKIIIESIIESKQFTNFTTIESNYQFYQQAKKNLDELGYLRYVNPILGCSLPFNKLLSIHQIRELLERFKDSKVYIDAPWNEALNFYSNETPKNCREDVLGSLMYDKQVDFLLLDSAGHLGFIEFQYAISLLENDCFIVLDDTNHIKHYNSKNYIYTNEDKFEMIKESDEKCGYLICKFKKG